MIPNDTGEITDDSTKKKKPPDVYFQSFLESVLAVWGTTHGKSILG